MEEFKESPEDGLGTVDDLEEMQNLEEEEPAAPADELGSEFSLDDAADGAQVSGNVAKSVGIVGNGQPALADGLPTARRVVRGRRPKSPWYMSGCVIFPAIFAVCFVAAFAYLWFSIPPIDPLTGEKVNRGKVIGNMIRDITQPRLPLTDSFEGRERLNFLLVGLDHVPGRGDDPGVIRRSDSVLVASIGLETKQIRVVSIPRDSWVQHYQNDKLYGYDRLAHAYSEGQQYNLRKKEDAHAGGIDRVRETVEKLLDIEIDYYCVIEFEGMVEVVNTVCPDGLEVDVEKNMKYSDKAGGLYIDLKKGLQKLNGEQVVQYARYRKYAMGDVTRTEKQQKVLKLLVAEMKKPQNLPRVIKAAPILQDSLKTNLTPDKLLALAQHMDEFDSEHMKTMTIAVFPNLDPGHEMDIPGLTVDQARSQGHNVLGIFKSGREEAKALLDDLAVPPPPEPEVTEGGEGSEADGQASQQAQSTGQ